MIICKHKTDELGNCALMGACDIQGLCKYYEPVEYAPVVRGVWVYKNLDEYTCSRCGRSVLDEDGTPEIYYPYCNCGAKMSREG